MNKQELIDKVVDRCNGVWPIRDDEVLCCSETLERICNKEFFNRRAKELGWISGYLWGKEYPTNGKIPDLPNDIIVQLRLPESKLYSKPDTVKAWELYFHKCEAFLINDERYKPKQPESHSKPSVDSSWHEKGQLPPVGEFCEYDFPNPDVSWQKVEVNYISGMNAILTLETGEERHADNFGPKHFRPFKSERGKFVEAALSEFDKKSDKYPPTKSEWLTKLFGEMHDAGCRFVSQESSR